MARALLLAAVAVLAGCGASATRSRQHDSGPYEWLYADALTQSAERDYQRECPARVQAALPGALPVNFDDGVDRCEAQTIAEQRVGALGCGSVGPPFDNGRLWLVQVRIGVDGRHLVPVQIDKHSGQVSGAPSPGTLP